MISWPESSKPMKPRSTRWSMLGVSSRPFSAEVLCPARAVSAAAAASITPAACILAIDLAETLRSE
jgi:hypothetical protein